ncbi:MAG: MBL fold metallo-hydrolase [Candidatus Aenigmarchaeota archaeon]|nr:MBL fold metallo-hydrolase [Candidatus Aenigmarchaeota archaeon]
MSDLLRDLRWFGHASFSIFLNKKNFLYIDPFQIPETKEKADVIFITHAHYDHFSEQDLKRILKPETVLVGPANLQQELVSPARFIPVESQKTYNIFGIKVETIPAYNTKEDRLSFHPRANNWVGFVLNLPAGRLYHAGDTDFVPEMRELKNIDVALLPMGGKFTMGVEEAAEAANTIKAKLTIPMHYKMVLKEKAREAEENFSKLVKGETMVLREFIPKPCTDNCESKKIVE